MSGKAFTLIEILVVVALIALLIAILLPSLARAREQARMVLCQSNLRQLGQAFLQYVNDNRGRFPGSSSDDGADWLGSRNIGGRQPDDGVIFKKYLGRNVHVYSCPDDNTPRPASVLSPSGWYYSYTGNLLLSGAKPEMAAGAHYPLALTGSTPQYNRNDHRTAMRAFDGVPLLMEEDPEYAMIPMPDSAWCNYDTLISRHLIPLGTTRNGWANIGFTDSHVSRVQWPKCPAIGNPFYFSNLMSPYYIEAFYCCIRTSGRKWVSGRSTYNWRYGSLDLAIPTDSVLH